MNKKVNITLVLVAICVLSAAGLSIVYDTTAPIIDENRRQAIIAAQSQVMPGALTFVALEADNLFTGEIRRVSQALDADGTLIGHTVLVETTGFQGKINLIFGINPGGKITKVKILENLETPGLGSRITEDSFLKQFAAMTIEDADVDAITGATISSLAVIESVKSSLDIVLRGLKTR